MANQEYAVLDSDLKTLRELASKVREIADGAKNKDCVRLWRGLDEGRNERPLLLAEEGSAELVMPGFKPKCKEKWAQAEEWMLLRHIIHHDMIRDDWPVEPFVNVPWMISKSDFGVEIKHVFPDGDFESKTAFHIDHPLKDLEADFHKLKHRSFSVDRAGTLAKKALLESVYDGLLGVEIRGNPWWTLGLTITAIDLIGLENLMIYMYEQPEALHKLMDFLSADNIALVKWMEAEGLLTLNNLNDYIGSGSRGYTAALPQSDFNGKVRTCDLWALIESQETVGVGPELYEEFVFQYEQRIAKLFGRVYLGCCEPVHNRWHVIRKLDNLKRVSVSPWCDEKFMAEALGRDYVYSRKPNPSLISMESFDEELIKADLRKTLTLTKANGCPTEIIMKDVHTMSGHPERLGRWVELARQEIAKIYR